MAEKNIKSRIVNKHDLESNWQLATGFTPMAGEIIVYDIDANYNYERIKIGDGSTNVNDLPFAVVQADWSVNDETSAAYVKNRTHYDGVELDEVLNKSIIASSGSVVHSTFPTLTVGEKYMVVYDGVTYISTVTNEGRFLCLRHNGNEKPYWMQDSRDTTGEFEISTEKKTLVIYKMTEKIYQLDEKYIPDTIARTSDVEAANIVYVGPDEPTDPNIKVWINTSEEGTGVVPVLPRVATVTLAASAWSGSSEPYSQVVNIATATATSKIDLQPTAQQIVSLQNSETSLMIENNNGAFTCYAIGSKPTQDYTIQVLIQEVAYV